MGLFQRLNALVLARVRERSGEVTVLKAVAAERQLVLTLSNGTEQAVDLRRLDRVVAVMHEAYAGKEVALLLALADPSQLLQIPESCPGWQEVCVALDSVPGSTPYATWYPSVLTNAGDVIVIRPQSSKHLD